MIEPPLLAIDPASPAPPFEQLRSQVTAAVASGALRPGTRLPTVRRLADDLALAPNTVARAYRELEADGVVEGRGRHGTFVRASGAAGEREALAAARAYLSALRNLGLPESDAEAYLRQAQGRA